MTRARTFDQVKASIFGDESLHKIVDGVNYGVCIDRLTQRLEAEIATGNQSTGGSKEYPSVLALSEDPEALLRVHSQQISQDQARQIVYAYVDEYECPDLDFTATTMRGCAWEGRIRLPQKPTLGLVLHEVAHIIQHNDKGFKRLGSGKRDVHGEDFARILDGLVRSEIACEKEVL